MRLKMFNKDNTVKHIGKGFSKNKTLGHLRDVEKYYVKKAIKLKMDYEYDVTADELPYFKTFAYTEHAHCFLGTTLCNDNRRQSIEEAHADDAEIKIDYLGYLKEKVNNSTSNKYSHADGKKPLPPRDHLIVPVGSNKIKTDMDMNKCKFIISQVGEENVYFKPHPITSNELIGAVKDQLEGDLNIGIVTDRYEDLYGLLKNAKVVHTSHRSESCVYAVALEKEIDPIDVYKTIPRASYYHINKPLFESEDPYNYMQKVFNSPKCGIFNPELETEWQKKIDMWFEYQMDKRQFYSCAYVYNKEGTI